MHAVKSYFGLLVLAIVSSNYALASHLSIQEWIVGLRRYIKPDALQISLETSRAVSLTSQSNCFQGSSSNSRAGIHRRENKHIHQVLPHFQASNEDGEC